MTDLEPLLQTHLGDWRSGWSMGSFGAIAEFHQDKGEQPVIDDGLELARATRRGGIRLERRRLADVTAIAYETLSPKRHRWSHAVALCLPEANARRAERKVLTEIGPDDHAIRGIDRTGILFDMGLGLAQCDFCIRTSDPKLLGELRANLGRSLFEAGNNATAAILSTHPHRVALTALGRVEVYQKIGGPDTGGVSPPGPHTHLLPKLLASGRHPDPGRPLAAGLPASRQSGDRRARRGTGLRSGPARGVSGAAHPVWHRRSIGGKGRGRRSAGDRRRTSRVGAAVRPRCAGCRTHRAETGGAACGPGR